MDDQRQRSEQPDGTSPHAAPPAKYRPAPAQIAHALAATTKPDRPNAPVEATRPDQTPAALAAVRARLEAGTDTCDCVLRSTRYDIDNNGVLSCPRCGHLEYGQAQDAIAAAAHLTAIPETEAA